MRRWQYYLDRMNPGELFYIVSRYDQVAQHYLGYAFEVRSSVFTGRGLWWLELQCQICRAKTSAVFTPRVIIKDDRRRLAVVDLYGQVLNDGVGIPNQTDTQCYNQTTAWVGSKSSSCRLVLNLTIQRFMGGVHDLRTPGDLSRRETHAVNAMQTIGVTTGRIKDPKDSQHEIIKKDLRIIRDD